MPTYSLYQVDAFTTQPLRGNPCAVVFDCSDLTDEVMLAIAKEMNLSETSFVWRMDDGRFRARYFTPAEEIPLAGHPTLATIYALIDSGRLKLNSGYRKLPLVLRDGPVDVEVFVKRKAALNLEKYAALRNVSDFFSPHLFCLQGVENGATFARDFGLPPDTLEDPFTGSATGGMAAYLWHYGLIENPTFIVEQGHWMNRPGQGYVEVVGPRDDIQTVKVGGAAVTVLKGKLTI